MSLMMPDRSAVRWTEAVRSRKASERLMFFAAAASVNGASIPMASSCHSKPACLWFALMASIVVICIDQQSSGEQSFTSRKIFRHQLFCAQT
jgi:hypothetical protein